MNALAPNVARRLVELREIMPELAVIAVALDGSLLCSYRDDQGVRCELVIPRDVDCGGALQ